MAGNYEQKIEESKAKLSDLITAINREELVLEDAQKKVAELTDLVNSKEIVLGNLNKELVDLKAKNKKEKEVFVKKEQEALEIIKSLNTEIDFLKESVETHKKLLDTQIKNGEKQLENALNVLKKEIKTLEAKKVIIEDSIGGFLSSKDKLIEENKALEIKNQELLSINASIGVVKKELEQLDILKSEITKDIFTISTEKTELVNKKDSEIANKQLEISSLDDLIKTRKEVLSVLVTEIDSIEEEKRKFVKEKMDIAKFKEDLDNREAFIKEKYEQAGINY